MRVRVIVLAALKGMRGCTSSEGEEHRDGAKSRLSSKSGPKRGRPRGRAQVREETPKEGCNIEHYSRCCGAQIYAALHNEARAIHCQMCIAVMQRSRMGRAHEVQTSYMRKESCPKPATKTGTDTRS